MNRSETAVLLGIAAAYDQRTVGESDVMAWQELLGDVRAADAVQAVKDHYSTETRRVMPVDVLNGVRRIRKDRLDRNPEPPPPDQLADDPRAQQAWTLEMRRCIADGELTTTVAEVNAAGQERLRQLIAGVGREVPGA